jgi:tetratricopeptide (TPR) repeat protein
VSGSGTTPNSPFRDARRRLFGSRQALADAVNQLVPDAYRVSDNDIGKIERGQVTWPRQPRRDAYRQTLQAATDEDLGFYDRRGHMSSAGGMAPDRAAVYGGSSPARGSAAGLASVAHISAVQELDWPAAGSVRPASQADTVVTTPQKQQSELLAKVSHTVSSVTSLAIGDDSYRELVADLVRWARSMNRREVLQWLTWAAGTAAASLELFDNLDPDERVRTAAALVQPERVDATVIRHIDDILWRCMRQDDALGPQAALNTVLAQRELVQGLLVGAGPTYRDGLLSLLANLSRFAGWLSFDLGNFDAASVYYEAARADAHEARNTELGALVLCNMSHLATWRGQPRVGIDHALAAQGWAAQTKDHRLRAYASDVAARAFAGDRRDQAARNAWEAAEREISEARGESRWAYFFTAGQLESTKAVCLLSLGQAEEAAVVAQAAVEGIDSSFVRNLGISSTYLGIARLNQCKPDVAAGAAALADAVQLSAHNRSVRLVQTLQGGLRQLERWHDEPAAGETLALARSYHLV